MFAPMSIVARRRSAPNRTERRSAAPRSSSLENSSKLSFDVSAPATPQRKNLRRNLRRSQRRSQFQWQRRSQQRNRLASLPLKKEVVEADEEDNEEDNEEANEEDKEEANEEDKEEANEEDKEEANEEDTRDPTNNVVRSVR